MRPQPQRWTLDALAADATQSAEGFRQERLAVSDAWSAELQHAHDKFERLMQALGDLSPGALDAAAVARVLSPELLEALRYLAGPPISSDDLQVIADVESMAPKVLAEDSAALARVLAVIARVIDPHRFPWVRAGTLPTAGQRESALLASAMLLAAQRIATERRHEGKDQQESTVRNYLLTLGLAEVPPAPIHTLVHGPQRGQFCAECQLGERKADVVVRLHDTRLLALECKVSNSATNSVKRLNNDAAVKAEYWLKTFGTAQVVPAALLAGVFKVKNLEQAQARGLALFWSHGLERLGEFIATTA